jgi:VWFA-related protein
VKRLAFLLLALPVAPQQQPDADSALIRVTVSLVQVDAIVTDKSGRVVTDLAPDEFEITQDGKPRKITRFAYIPTQTGPTPRPAKKAEAAAVPIPPPSYKPEQVRRTIVLVVDDLALSFEGMYYVRDAIKKFSASLQPGDRVAMMRTGSGAGAFQSFTTDHAQINQLADTLRWNFRSRTGVHAVAPMSGDTKPVDDADEEDSDTAEEDLMNRAAGLGTFGALQWIIDGLAPVPGRKSIVLLSEGFKIQTRSEGTDQMNDLLTDPLRRLTDQATRAGVVIYTVDPRGLQGLGLTAADNVSPRTLERQMAKRTRDFQQSQEPLRILAADTGGRAFLNSNAVDDSLRRVLDDQAGFYLLGYDPQDDTFDRKYHKITVKVKRKGLEVRSRNGFVGVEDKPRTASRAETPQQQLVRALNAPFQTSEIPLKLTGLFAADAQGNPYLHCLLHVDLAKIQLTPGADGKLHGQFEILVAGFDAAGASPHNNYKPGSITVEPAKLQEAVARGMFVTVAYPLKKPGPYQLRAAIRDGSTGAIGSGSQFVMAPDLTKGRMLLSSLFVASATKTDERVRLATRQFQPGEQVAYSLQVLNAKPETKLTIQVRLFDEGKQIFLGQETPMSSPKAANGVIRLGNAMKPGDYALQVIITDTTGGKPKRYSQWTDIHVKPAVAAAKP